MWEATDRTIQHHRYLGVHLSLKLNWKKHVCNIDGNKPFDFLGLSILFEESGVSGKYHSKKLNYIHMPHSRDKHSAGEH